MGLLPLTALAAALYVSMSVRLVSQFSSLL